MRKLGYGMGNLMSGLVCREKFVLEGGGDGFANVGGYFRIADDAYRVGYEQVQRAFELAPFVIGQRLGLVSVLFKIFARGFDEVEKLLGFFRSLHHHFPGDELGAFVDSGSGKYRRMPQGNPERGKVRGSLHRFFHPKRHALANGRTHHS